jgi:hypothetical protein
MWNNPQGLSFYKVFSWVGDRYEVVLYSTDLI